MKKCLCANFANLATFNIIIQKKRSDAIWEWLVCACNDTVEFAHLYGRKRPVKRERERASQLKCVVCLIIREFTLISQLTYNLIENARLNKVEHAFHVHYAYIIMILELNSIFAPYTLNFVVNAIYILLCNSYQEKRYEPSIIS